MSEFYRVPMKGGLAMLLVPITAVENVEDPSITDPAARLRLYGQQDHVRLWFLLYRPALRSRIRCRYEGVD